jgi:hypothetical protein
MSGKEVPTFLELPRGHGLVSASSFQEQARDFQRLEHVQDLLPRFSRGQVTLDLTSSTVDAQLQGNRGHRRTMAGKNQNECRGTNPRAEP